MKEKREMDVKFENTMEGIVNTLTTAHLSKDSDNPQVFEVKFKLPGTGYSYRSDFYRLVFDPNHLDSLGIAGDSLFLYQGDGILDKMMGLVEIQKNGKAIVVRDFWFGKKMTQTFRAEDMEFVSVIHYDANVEKNYKKVEEVSETEIENLPF
tara:strand:+ start:1046 stop:1501 length:456 start_codon:yes stop_codon:yes gene_type:complete